MPASKKPKPLTHEEEALLRVLNPALRGLLHTMDEDLRREQGMPSVEYGLLMFLSEAPDRRMRIGELAALSFQSLSGMSRTVTRLETLGYVRRVQCETDARSREVELTDTGFSRLKEAWPTHLRSVRRSLIDPLEGTNIAGITAALEKIAEAVGFGKTRR